MAIICNSISRRQAERLFKHREDQSMSFDDIRKPIMAEVLLSDGSKLLSFYRGGCYHYSHRVYDCGGSALAY